MELDRTQPGGTWPTGCEVEENSGTEQRGQTGKQLPLPQLDGNKEQLMAQERAKFMAQERAKVKMWSRMIPKRCCSRSTK